MKKWTKPVSLESVYKKSISFHVERYEEWQCGLCINKGSLAFDIHLNAKPNGITVEIPYAEKFRTHNNVTFSFVGSIVLKDRVQYLNPPFANIDPTQPILLHIFVENNAITYIRFGMSFPDRIVELYGYQLEEEY